MMQKSRLLAAISSNVSDNAIFLNIIYGNKSALFPIKLFRTFTK